MIEIIPAVMPENIEDLERKLGQVAGAVPLVQIDVMDGRFTPSQSWPYQKKQDIYFEQIVNEDRGLPFWEDLDFEIDLMVMNPLQTIDAWVAAGAKRLLIHVESTEAIEAIKELRNRFPKDDPVSLEIGAAIGLDTPLETLNEIASDLDVIQCMGIAKIGYQHEPFDERVLSRIAELRKRLPESIISVDGGVTLENAPDLIAAGADRLVSGSAIFTAPNPREVIREFQKVL
jgi:ribulose-phosphate 3-epimerase